MVKRRVIPISDDEFDIFFKNIVKYCAVKCEGTKPAYPHIPKDAMDELSGTYGQWYTDYSACRNSPTEEQKRIKRRTREVSEKILRQFITEFLRFSRYVSDLDCENMHIYRPEKSARKSPGVPNLPVTGRVSNPGRGLVMIDEIMAEADTQPELPTNCGVCIYYGILGEGSSGDKIRLAKIPVSGEDLPHSVFTKKKKFIFNLYGESANTVYFCMRYENNQNDKGPWGPIIKAVIT